MRNSSLAILIIAVQSPSAALAADLRVYPPEVTISGPNRVQQLLVVEEENGRVLVDRTATATFATSNPAVATVDAAGLVNVPGTGEATVTGTVGGRSVTVTVKASA